MGAMQHGMRTRAWYTSPPGPPLGPRGPGIAGPQGRHCAQLGFKRHRRRNPRLRGRAAGGRERRRELRDRVEDEGQVRPALHVVRAPAVHHGHRPLELLHDRPGVDEAVVRRNDDAHAAPVPGQRGDLPGAQDRGLPEDALRDSREVVARVGAKVRPVVPLNGLGDRVR
eukprot:CAMPEP_0206007882 /NCGR_PEP_ID=MMETSP1464-20131121/6348_1 /ASSEMBLY_ACC=CAM_ASM_001124 /TAXON_ID=119497 /ORGANISM="Exanthemachrysis gayraliae, Strain RCC1523" /LENGTH=168 /DNA_ID=CAMNT_0053381393 /DNA_START=145 /DNA_END=647 /DNA_ORIENTATION=+